MKYQIIRTAAVLCILLSLVCFSGCLQQQSSPENPEQNQSFNQTNDESKDSKENTTSPLLIFEDVEISDYQISTSWITGCCGEFEYNIKSGFYHKLPVWSNASYQIGGKIKNTCEENLALIRINISFYNAEGSELFDLNNLNKSITITNLSPKLSEAFSVDLYVSDYHKFNNSASFDDSFYLFHKVESLAFSVSSMK